MVSDTTVLSVFKKYPNLVLGFSDKSDGNMRAKPSGSDNNDTLYKRNREVFLKKLGIDAKWVVSPLLAHGTNVKVADEHDRGKAIPDTDALVTDKSNVFLTVTVADCLPIYIYDPEHNAIALTHAGWRGMAGNIIKNTVETLKKTYDSSVSSLVIAIGPHIGGCHYEVGNDVARQFDRYRGTIRTNDGRNFLDLGLVAIHQFSSLGVDPRQISADGVCTYEADNFFSYRRDKPGVAEVMLAVFGMR